MVLFRRESISIKLWSCHADWKLNPFITALGYTMSGDQFKYTATRFCPEITYCSYKTSPGYHGKTLMRKKIWMEYGYTVYVYSPIISWILRFDFCHITGKCCSSKYVSLSSLSGWEDCTAPSIFAMLNRPSSFFHASSWSGHWLWKSFGKDHMWRESTFVHLSLKKIAFSLR